MAAYIRSLGCLKAKAAHTQAVHKARQDSLAMGRVAAEIEFAATDYMTSYICPLYSAVREDESGAYADGGMALGPDGLQFNRVKP